MTEYCMDPNCSFKTPHVHSTSTGNDLMQPNPNREVPSGASNYSETPKSSESRCECSIVPVKSHGLRIERCAHCLNQDAEIAANESAIAAQAACIDKLRSQHAAKDAEIARLKAEVNTLENERCPNRWSHLTDEIARLTQELAWAKDEHQVQSETIGKYQEELAAKQQNWASEIIAHENTKYEFVLLTSANHRLSEQVKVAEEALEKYARLFNWDNYRGTLNPHVYWKGESEREPWNIATKALATIAKLRGEK